MALIFLVQLDINGFSTRSERYSLEESIQPGSRWCSILHTEHLVLVTALICSHFIHDADELFGDTKNLNQRDHMRYEGGDIFTR